MDAGFVPILPRMTEMSTNKFCWKCGKELPFDTRILRSEQCPWCSADLHCCLACVFHDRSAYNECTENSAFEVQDKERANFCNEFRFKEGEQEGDSEADRAKEKLKDLFKF